MKRRTKAIHTGVRTADPSYGSVVPPIYPSSTFAFPDAIEGAHRFAWESSGMVYSRWTNPTVRALEERVAAVEGADECIAVASGMAAITGPMFSLLKQGDHVVAHCTLYGASFDFINRCLPKYGIESTFTNFTDIESLKAAIKPNTKLIYLETPTNPTMEIIDIAAVVAIAREHGIVTMIDASFAPRPMQDNIGLGVDIVVHSLTKYMGGHSDLIAGAILGKKELLLPIRKDVTVVYGPTMSPFTAYLIMRGIATLDIRVKQINENALKVAQFLEKHPDVEQVFYPGLQSHPQYELAQKQMPGGYGAVMSFIVKGGFEKAQKIANNIKVFTLAVSLGGVESLIQHPASMTHSKMTEEERAKAGIKSGLIRISVGIEDIDDQIAALEEAFKTT